MPKPKKKISPKLTRAGRLDAVLDKANTGRKKPKPKPKPKKGVRRGA